MSPEQVADAKSRFVAGDVLGAPLKGAAIVFGVVLAASLFGILTRPTGLLATFWPANAILLGVLLRYPRLATGAGWFAAVAGFVTADMLTGSLWLKSMLLTAGNMAGICVGYALYQRVDETSRRLQGPASMAHLAVILIAASGAAGLVGTAANPILFGGGVLEGFGLWFVTEFVNYIALLPVVLAMPSSARIAAVLRDPGAIRARWREAAPVVAFVVSLMLGVAIDGPIALTIPVPALLWCALAYGMFMTGVLTLIFTIWTLMAVAIGYLSLGAAFTTFHELLQLRLGVMLIAIAPITAASVMAARDESLRVASAARAAAEDAVAVRARMLANISHEIRTPMNAVIGLSGLALGADISDRTRDYLRKINRASVALLRIINDILDFSKIEAGRLTIENMVFDLDAMLRDVATLAVELRGAKPIEIAFVTTAATPRILLGDPLRLGQIVLNLVSNALKFTERGAIAVRVDTAARAHGRVTLRFEVSDTGIGMTPAAQTRLFQPFSQVEGATTRRVGGTGLGLVIAKQLVELMGGRIGVDSVPGEGSRFFFTVELGDEEMPGARAAPITIRVAAGEGMSDEAARGGPAADAAAWAIREDARLKGKRVLLVEDNEINQQIAREMLTDSGVDVTIADGGAQALAWLDAAETLPDAILMDIQMPDMDGYDTARLIRALPRCRDLPIIAMTAHVTAAERAQCVEAGMVDHVGKPVELRKLLDTLARWTGAAADRVEAEGQDGASAAPSGVLDIAGARARLGVAPAMMHRLVTGFAAQYREAPAALAALYRAGDRPEALRYAHTLAGLAATIGANDLAACGRALEIALRPGGDAGWPDPAAFEAAHEAVFVVLARHDISATRPAAAVAPPPDARRLAELIRAMDAGLASNRLSARTMLDDLRAVSGDVGGAELARLSDDLARLDFAAARSTLRALAAVHRLPPEAQ